MAFFLGIDGGGTKTRCVIGDESSLLGAGSSSSCKVQRVGEAPARDALSAAIHQACEQAGISPPQISRTCAGISGSGRIEIAGVTRDLISGIVGGEVEVIGDVEIAFTDAFGAGPGMILIAGTGSIAYGRNSEGETARAGGWGPAISDEGSGYWIGVEAARSALRAQDRGERLLLLQSLVEALDARSINDFIVRVNSNPLPDYAALFPVVLSAAGAGDSIANEILARAGQELANVAEIAIHRLFPQGEDFPIATHGGIFASSPLTKKTLVQQLESKHSGRCKWLSRDIDAARGALARARSGPAGANAGAFG